MMQQMESGSHTLRSMDKIPDIRAVHFKALGHAQSTGYAGTSNCIAFRQGNISRRADKFSANAYQLRKWVAHGVSFAFCSLVQNGVTGSIPITPTIQSFQTADLRVGSKEAVSAGIFASPIRTFPSLGTLAVARVDF